MPRTSEQPAEIRIIRDRVGASVRVVRDLDAYLERTRALRGDVAMRVELRRAAEEGDEVAMTSLIEAHLELAARAALAMRTDGVDEFEAIEQANALLVAHLLGGRGRFRLWQYLRDLTPLVQRPRVRLP